MGLIRGYIIRKCNQAQARQDAITNANCARILASYKACEAAKEPESKVVPSFGQMIIEIEEKEKEKIKKKEEEEQAKLRAIQEKEERMRKWAGE
jgi:cytochrome c551/c552